MYCASTVLVGCHVLQYVQVMEFSNLAEAQGGKLRCKCGSSKQGGACCESQLMAAVVVEEVVVSQLWVEPVVA